MAPEDINDGDSSLRHPPLRRTPRPNRASPAGGSSPQSDIAGDAGGGGLAMWNHTATRTTDQTDSDTEKTAFMASVKNQRTSSRRRHNSESDVHQHGQDGAAMEKRTRKVSGSESKRSSKSRGRSGSDRFTADYVRLVESAIKDISITAAGPQSTSDKAAVSTEHNFIEVNFKRCTVCKRRQTMKSMTMCTGCNIIACSKCIRVVTSQPCLKSATDERFTASSASTNAKKHPPIVCCRGHIFLRHYFKKPTYCSHCGNFMWGVKRSQGYRCALCLAACHFQCAEFAVHCSKAANRDEERSSVLSNIETKYGIDKQTIDSAALKSDTNSGLFKFDDPNDALKGASGVEDEEPETFNSEYELGEEVLGSGQFGVVKECFHKTTRERRAVKILFKKKLFRNEKARQVLKREHETLLKLNHIANIVHVHDMYEGLLGSKAVTYIIMEYIDGGDLASFVYHSDDECLSNAEAKHIFRSIINTMNIVHKHGVIHRDLKPENILLKGTAKYRDGGRLEDLGVVVADFGFARGFDGIAPEEKADGGPEPNNISPFTRMTRMKMTIVGTPAYTAPEITAGDVYGLKADVYSTGIMLYCLVSMMFPSEADDNDEYFNETSGDIKFVGGKWDSAEHPESLKDLLRMMLKDTHPDRCTMAEALEQEWLRT